MDFELPEELREIQRTVRELCEAKVKPRARAWDETGEFPWEVVRELGPLGLMGIAVPEEYGGAGLGALAVAVVIEAARRRSLALTVASHNGLGTGHILPLRQRGSGAAISRRSPGGKLAAWGLTEPGSGSDAASLKTTAVGAGRLGPQRHEDVHHPGIGGRHVRRPREHRRRAQAARHHRVRPRKGHEELFAAPIHEAPRLRSSGDRAAPQGRRGARTQRLGDLHQGS